MNPQKQRLVALIMVLSVSSVVSFSLRSTSHVCDASRPFFCTSTSLNGILDGDDGSKSDGVDFATFNPLKQNNSGSKKTAAFGYTGTRISLRKTTMSEMTNKLLSSGGDSETMNSILEEYRDFLLEPLEDQEAVLETDSIYSSGMSREDRFDAYRKSMDERVESCKNVQVRQVLESMRDYVLNFENK